MRGERLLLVVTPALALTAVALGLRLGARGSVRAAIITAAPPSGAGTGLAWQVAVFDDDHGVRQPAVVSDLDVTGRRDETTTHWSGATNEDGVAEVNLPCEQGLKAGRNCVELRGLELEVRADEAVVALGGVAEEGSLVRSPPASAWSRFARREGRIGLDVAVLGQRVASGFPAHLWVRATQAESGSAVAGAVITVERDESLSPAAAEFRTDSRGWAHIVATPMGHAVALFLHARATDGLEGDWAGALFVSPGAAQIVTRDRYAPDEPPTFDVVFPNVRSNAYVEIDDARGRAWATTLPLVSTARSLPRATVYGPKLARGLYWAVASGDAAAGASLGAGTAVRPFFVAETDTAALAFGTDAAVCAPPLDARESARVASLCLALAGASPVPRWVALDGFARKAARDSQRRASGLRVAIGAIGVAALLETLLLLRAVRRSRASLRETIAAAAPVGADVPGGALDDVWTGRAATLGIALLVALLGFALLAAFIARVG